MAPLVTLAAGALLLAGASGAAAQSAAGAPTKLTISYSEKVADMLPLLIASDAGYFKKRNLDVTVQYLPAQQGVPALLTDQIQIAGIGGSDAISAVAQGAKLKFVLTLSPVYTFQFWARPQFGKPAALKGQQIGVTSTTGSLYSGTLIALHELGLKPSDVTITPLGSFTNVNNALIAGSIAAGCSHPPATYEFQTRGFVNLVDLPKKKIPSINDGLLLTTAYLQAHPKIVQDVVDAVLEAFAREKADKAFAESEMKKAFGVEGQAELDYTYDFYAHEVIAPGPLPTVAQLASNQKWMSVMNPKVASVDVATMIDQSFVKKAEK